MFVYYYDSDIKLNQSREHEFVYGVLVIYILYMIGNVRSRENVYPWLYCRRDENYIVEITKCIR